MVKLTKELVEALSAADKPQVYFDDETKGFGVRVTPNGHKSFVIEYRLRDGPRSAAKKRLKIGLCGVLSVRDARNLAKVKLATVVDGRDPACEAQARREESTIGEAAAEFRALREKLKKEKTLASERGLWENWILPRLAKKRLSAVTTRDVESLHRWMGIDNGKPISANRAAGLLRSFFNWAERRGDFKGSNPVKGLEFFPEKGRQRYLSMPEIDRLAAALRLAETSGIPWKERADWKKHAATQANRVSRVHPSTVAAIRLLIFTGLRLREALHLTWREVDFDKGLLWLADSKTGARSVVLSGASVALLQEVRARLAEAPLPEDAVFAETIPEPGENGHRPPAMPRADLKKPWAAATRQAGLPGLRLHDLRHSLASVAVQSGLSLPTIGGLLGHTNQATTQRYAHLDNSSLRRAADLVAGQLESAMNGSRANG
ncbi:tyrosine-type recombinase/integrase [Novosphingobium sp.]|uniref:tyrosine-type recombinase/integrase n=1 Tax=Novosphingobium sp. TaxID=1874826 RepID=UPI003B52F6D5